MIINKAALHTRQNLCNNISTTLPMDSAELNPMWRSEGNIGLINIFYVTRGLETNSVILYNDGKLPLKALGSGQNSQAVKTTFQVAIFV